jgi:hypothetical protein
MLFRRIWQAVMNLLPEEERVTWVERLPVLSKTAQAVPTLSEDWY